MSKVPVLFDVNGSFGKGAAGSAEFPTIRERLDFMDRFGIGRSLVWNVESTQHHGGSCNQRLIDEIDTTAGARGRIIPALAVSGLMPYEKGGIDTLLKQMEASGSRALRFVNVFGRLSLCQLEPVMRRIRPLKPFIVTRHDQVQTPDALEFAAMFPDVPIILTDVMWPPCITVFDLMRRRPNIMVENSWLHSGGAIEQVVRHFGPDRLFFGTGNKCHNGAAMGALARADVTEAQRKQVAHGNLDRLMGSKTPALSIGSGLRKDNTLWPRFLQGKCLDVDIVDAHAHLGPSGGYVLETQLEAGQKKVAESMTRAIGVKTMIFSGMQALLGAAVEGNDLLESVLRPHQGRFLGYVGFNPYYADEIVKRFKPYFAGKFFVGFKTLCDYWGVPITDPRFKPMWEYANRHRLPVLSHTWDGHNNSPRLFKDLVRRYRNIPFLLGHSGGGTGGRREAEELAADNKNVYLEWCGSFCTTARWEDTLKTIPVQQIVFGTDAMAHDMNWELARLLSLNISDRMLLPILGGNMRRILAGRRK